MRKSYIAVGIMLILSIGLTGCGSMPNLTEEQSDVISEYATSLLLKYDTEEHSRLIDTDAMIDKYNKAWDEYNEAKAKYEKELAKEEKKKKQEEEKQKEDNVADKSESPANGGATVIDTMTIGQFLGVDYDIDYSGYSIVKNYPEDSTDFFFSMDATAGHDLLVVIFNATNKTGQSDELDIMSKNLTFKLSVNGEGYHSAYKTMLDDDLSEFVGTFNANETKPLVLIAEVEEGKTISSIDLRISDINSNVITKQILK